MCLRTQSSEVHCCIKSIKAYKVLLLTEDEMYVSPYKCYDYTRYVKDNTLVKDCIPQPIFECSSCSYVVNEGLHLCSDLHSAMTEMWIAEGSYGNNAVVFECEIPPGSVYIRGEEDICTNQFRFIKEINMIEGM